MGYIKLLFSNAASVAMAFLILLQLAVYVFIFLITLWYYLYFKYEKYLKKFPGPRPIPLLGNALEFRDSTELLSTFLRFQKEYGGMAKVRFGFDAPSLLITDPKALEYFLGSTKILYKSEDYRYLHSWLGTGLLTSGGPKWRKHRKILTPTFHFQILEQFLEVFDKYSDVLVEKLKKESGKGSFDIYPYITLCSLDIICATAMGTIVNAQKETDSEYVQCVKEMCRIVTERAISPTKSRDSLYMLSSDYQTERKALKILHNYTNSVIVSRKKELENSQTDARKENVDDFGIKKRKAFLDLLLEYRMEGQPMSDEEIREEVDTFMFEGHDTTSSAVGFIMHCIATYPEIQKKVFEELKSIFDDDKTRSATYQELQEMKYLEQVIKESLRVYPAAPIYSRNLHEDIEYDGTILPKNLTLIFFAYGVHKDPKFFPDPEKFDPDRFAAENQSKRPTYAYVPFSAGPRNCIGQKFAMLEMKSLVSKILRHYEVLPSIPEHKPIVMGEIVLKSRNGIHIRLKNRVY